MEPALDLFRGLTADQRKAATLLDCNTLVTAGAGTGKTKALVARYVALLVEGCRPPEILAVTFTDKAALEMRGRVRMALQELVETHHGTERGRWLALESELDAARIGTIHSFCAELLRSHPAEAEVDPRFRVAEEGIATALKAEAVEAALAWAANERQTAPLFDSFRGDVLRSLLLALLKRRADAAEGFARASDGAAWSLYVGRELADFAKMPDVREAIAELERLRAGAALPAQHAAEVAGLLAGWQTFTRELAAGQVFQAARALFELRRQHLGLRSIDPQVKPAVCRLRTVYGNTVDHWLGGEKKAEPPDPAVQEQFVADLARLGEVFAFAEREYCAALAARQALDFDDLELGAVRLLAQAPVRQRWQETLKAILVDEFQDTNPRQAAIVDALCGDHDDRLFVVGDARQSIYRFRGADVTVFRRTEERFAACRWEVLALRESFRTHAQLLQAIDHLLEPILRVPPDSAPLDIGYEALVAHRTAPPAGLPPPYVEFCLGAGADIGAARPAAARALADRLLELRHTGQMEAWSDVAVLFRASRSYQIYESAFETAGIPFVTVAGVGFYDRPEVRDLLNMLRAIAEPWNDLALAGLLRSPAFAIRDSALYRLRIVGDRRRPLRRALAEGVAELDGEDAIGVQRAARLLADLEPLADRLPVAELLSQLLERTDYRAVLAASDVSRLWRNVDKLMEDARASGLVRVREFLEYVNTLRDVEVREAEAAVEAAGAVRLMTVHKAKGLEFPVVVIGDASHAGSSRQELFYVVRGLGIAAGSCGRSADQPLAVKLAAWHDQRETDAEGRRLLYVAATRARDKLIVSGTVTLGRNGPTAHGWLEQLLAALEVDLAALVERADGGWLEHRVDESVFGLCLVRAEETPPRSATAPDHEPDGTASRIATSWADDAAKAAALAPEEGASPASAATGDATVVGPADAEPSRPAEEPLPLYRPVPVPRQPTTDSDSFGEPRRTWRASGTQRVPATALGSLVHRALQHWRFPDDPALDALLDTAALEERLVADRLRREAIRLAKELLARFRGHALWAVIDGAGEANRFHELPYIARLDEPGTPARSGRIDLVYRDARGWHIVDFKTDHLADANQMRAVIEARGYREQLAEYVTNLERLASVTADACLCFLDVGGAVHVEPL